MARYVALALYRGMTLAFVGNHKRFGFCTNIMWSVLFSGTVIVTCSNILLIQRVSAFCGRSKLLLWFLSLTFILGESSAIVVLALDISKYHVVDLKSNLPSSFGNCVIEHYSGILSLILFLELGFQSVAFTCIIARVVPLMFTSWKTGLQMSPLYMDILRDGIWVYMILFLTFLLSGIYMHTESLRGLSFAMMDICGIQYLLYASDIESLLFSESCWGPLRSQHFLIVFVVQPLTLLVTRIFTAPHKT